MREGAAVRLDEEPHDFGPRPEPKLARGPRVSRQAVQPLVDALAAAEKLAARFLADHITVTRRILANLLFATTGARPWQFPRLRPGYAALYGPDAIDDTAARHPLGRAGRHLR